MISSALRCFVIVRYHVSTINAGWQVCMQHVENGCIAGTFRYCFCMVRICSRISDLARTNASSHRSSVWSLGTGVPYHSERRESFETCSMLTMMVSVDTGVVYIYICIYDQCGVFTRRDLNAVNCDLIAIFCTTRWWDKLVRQFAFDKR